MSVKVLKSSKSKTVLFITIFVAVASAILDFFTPASGDDLKFWVDLGFENYAYPNRHTLSFIAAHIFGCNGRVFDYVGPVVVNLLPRGLAAILMGAMAGLFFYVILKAIRIPANRHHYVYFISSLIILSTPWWDALWLRVCQFNYTWGSTFCILFICLFFQNKDYNPNKLKGCLLFILSLCAGATHEQTAIAMCVSFALYILLSGRPILSVGRKVMLWGLFVGAVFPVCAPSIWLRFSQSQEQSVTYPVFDLLWTTFPLLLILVLVISIGLAFRKYRRSTLNLLRGECGVYVCAAIIAAAIAIVSRIPGRTGLFSECCALICMTRIVLRLNMKESRKFVGLLSAISIAFIAGHYATSIIWQMKIFDEHCDMTQKYMASTDGIIYADYTQRYDVPNLALGRIKGVPDSDDLWLKKCLAQAYRSDSIPLIVLPEQMRGKIDSVRDAFSLNGVTVYASCPNDLAVTDMELLIQHIESEEPRVVTKTVTSQGVPLWIATPLIVDPGDIQPTVKFILP